ncbi:MAG: hypothetical protein A2010_14310 [Nitrospirae bacterium GWD2_57_9]|nr:MAG: hypothetical protein A2010_14310 [Nitrospirae bacterium GWD2_57_9]OGW46046.1 MAG: hypothetical protein A2078_11815 [Nitrospirae bacterium GWC2_57_9]
MYRTMLLCLCLFLTLLGTAIAEPKESAARKPAAKETAAKQLSGMSIVGNDEAPKSLYIMPWKKSEIGAETSLNMMLTESAVPVDREVFLRQLDFFEVRTRK